MKWGSDDEDDFKRLDFGLGIGAGVAFNAFEVGLGYALGLANISSYTEGGSKASHKVFSVSVAYKFGN